MWLRRSKSSQVRIHHAPLTKFACSSFKDVHLLLSDDLPTTPIPAAFSAVGSPRIPSSICHRILRFKSLSQSLPDSQPQIPGAEKTIVVYFSSIRVVRRTFEDCRSVLTILRSFRVALDERDVSMDVSFTNELCKVFGVPEKTKLSMPRVFIAGRYFGGVEEIRRMHESGELKKIIEGLELNSDSGTCETCGGHRFVLCSECSGSHKCYYSAKAGFRSCVVCNVNGLVRCPSCFSRNLTV